MRRYVMLAATLVLVACASEEPAQESETVAADFVTSNGSPPGVYEASAADGTVSIITLNADGTYSQVAPDGTQAATGTLEVVDGKTCFRVRVAGAEPLCYVESEIAADGSFTATPEGGEPLTVRPYTAPAETGA